MFLNKLFFFCNFIIYTKNLVLNLSLTLDSVALMDLTKLELEPNNTYFMDNPFIFTGSIFYLNGNNNDLKLISFQYKNNSNYFTFDKTSYLNISKIIFTNEDPNSPYDLTSKIFNLINVINVYFQVHSFFGTS